MDWLCCLTIVGNTACPVLLGMLHEQLNVTAYVEAGLLCSAMLVGEGGVGQHGYNSTESTSKLIWHS